MQSKMCNFIRNVHKLDASVSPLFQHTWPPTYLVEISPRVGPPVCRNPIHIVLIFNSLGLICVKLVGAGDLNGGLH